MQISSAAPGGGFVSSRLVEANREINGHRTFISTTAFSTTTNVQDISIVTTEPKLWHENRVDQRMSGKTNVVDSLPKTLEWEIHIVLLTISYDHIRFIDGRVGWHVQPGDHPESNAYFALKSFAKDKSDIHVHNRVGNRVTQAQIKKVGPRSQDLLTITQQIWHYC